MTKSIEEVTLLSEQDIFLFNEGSHFRLYEKLGSHLLSAGEGQGMWLLRFTAPLTHHLPTLLISLERQFYGLLLPILFVGIHCFDYWQFCLKHHY